MHGATLCNIGVHCNISHVPELGLTMSMFHGVTDPDDVAFILWNYFGFISCLPKSAELCQYNTIAFSH